MSKSKGVLTMKKAQSGLFSDMVRWIIVILAIVFIIGVVLVGGNKFLNLDYLAFLGGG